MTSFNEMKPRYTAQWAACQILPSWKDTALNCVATIKANRPRYEAAQRASGIWWPVIACIHGMESSFSFRGHLHNGDPLTARTVQVPEGRPRTGTPPFTWEFSAADALGMVKDNLDAAGGSLDVVERCLYFLELYNGTGYQDGAGRNTTPAKTSPYLWSGTNQWVRGKYVMDGRFDPNAGSSQFGVAGILKALEIGGLISFNAPTEKKAKPLPYEPAAVPAPFSMVPAMVIGEKSERVRWLIAALMGLGFLAKDETTTDVFNAVIQDAVIWFQGKTKIEIDGAVGQETAGKICERLTSVRAGNGNAKARPAVSFATDTIVVSRGAPSLERPLWAGLVPIVVSIAGNQWICASGQSWAQNFRLPSDPASVPGNMEPIPQGEYRLGAIDFYNGDGVLRPGDSDGMGGCFIPIQATFGDDRGAFGFHLDSNISLSPGSAGCVVFYHADELELFIAQIKKYKPKKVIVKWDV